MRVSFLFALVLAFTATATPPLGTTGFIPVNAQSSPATGHIFFWFIPPRDGNPRAPLVLWLQGGPGGSGIQDGLLFIHGPLRLSNGTLARREVSWNNHFAMLYVDQPVGTGYSFTTNASDPATYARSEKAVAEMMFDFLSQFYARNLWPRENPLVVAGESYGGHYCPVLASKILEGEFTNLHGVAIGDGLTDPGTQVLTKPLAAYNFGLIDERLFDEATVHARNASSLSSLGNYRAAKMEREVMEELVRNASGINVYDVRRFGYYDTSAEAEWLNSSSTKTMLGVPLDVKFGTEELVKDALADDVMRSVRDYVPSLLKLPRGLLVYTGQFDWKDGVASNEAWLSKIDWKGKTRFSAAPRTLFHHDGPNRSRVPYGWGKVYDGGHIQGRLSWVTLADAGHMAPHDQPEAALAMITGWIEGDSWWQKSPNRKSSAGNSFDPPEPLLAV